MHDFDALAVFFIGCACGFVAALLCLAYVALRSALSKPPTESGQVIEGPHDDIFRKPDERVAERTARWQ